MSEQISTTTALTDADFLTLGAHALKWSVRKDVMVVTVTSADRAREVVLHPTRGVLFRGRVYGGEQWHEVPGLPGLSDWVDYLAGATVLEAGEELSRQATIARSPLRLKARHTLAQLIARRLPTEEMKAALAEVTGPLRERALANDQGALGELLAWYAEVTLALQAVGRTTS